MAYVLDSRYGNLEIRKVTALVAHTGYRLSTALFAAALAIRPTVRPSYHRSSTA